MLYLVKYRDRYGVLRVNTFNTWMFAKASYFNNMKLGYKVILVRKRG